MKCTHQDIYIHLDLTRLPDHAAVRSEIETFLEARQSSPNPDAMDTGSLNGQQGVCRSCGQREHLAAECPKRGKNGQEAKVRMAKDRARKGNQVKGNLMFARRKAKAKVTNCTRDI